jgi:hypothetical protein
MPRARAAASTLGARTRSSAAWRAAHTSSTGGEGAGISSRADSAAAAPMPPGARGGRGGALSGRARVAADTLIGALGGFRKGGVPWSLLEYLKLTPRRQQAPPKKSAHRPR